MKDNEIERTDQDSTVQDRAMQDIQTIKSFLAHGQKKLEDSGFHFIFWGLLIPAGFIGYTILAALYGHHSFFGRYFWPVLCGAGGITSFVVGSLSSRSESHFAYAEKVSTSLWIGNLLSIGLLFAVFFLAKLHFSISFLSTTAIILGLSYWVYGTMIQLHWFTLFALGWWIAAIAISLANIQVAGIILSAATFVCSFIPGCILFFRKQTGRN